MSQTKAQLIQPIGIVTAGGVVVTGVVTASSFDGDVVGTATSIISGGNLTKVLKLLINYYLKEQAQSA